MKTIELDIDESLLAQIDRVTHELSLSRSVFIQRALEAALRRQTILALERQHAKGYDQLPVDPNEIDEWEGERVWEQP